MLLLPLFSFAEIIQPGGTYTTGGQTYTCTFSDYGCDTSNVSEPLTGNETSNIYGWGPVGGTSFAGKGAGSTCTVPPKNFSELMCVITYSILSPLIPILVTLALIAFFWGVARYAIKGADDEKAREQGKQIMIWGIIGLFVIVSVWGLVAVVQNTFNLGNASFKSGNVRIPGR